jgi:hypothetical protein
MAEVEKVPAQPGEMSARFIQFVMMQTQNVLYSLGLIAPEGSEPPEPNLEIAHVLIDQLEMIYEKTRGNLTKEETEVITNSLQRLRLTFVEMVNELRGGSPGAPTPAPESAAPAPDAPAPTLSTPPPSDPDDDGSKRFTKKYG